jgi:hypothetical protein
MSLWRSVIWITFGCTPSSMRIRAQDFRKRVEVEPPAGGAALRHEAGVGTVLAHEPADPVGHREHHVGLQDRPPAEAELRGRAPLPHVLQCLGDEALQRHVRVVAVLCELAREPHRGLRTVERQVLPAQRLALLGTKRGR